MDADDSPTGARPRDGISTKQLVAEVGVFLAQRSEALAVGETSAGGALSTLVHSDPTQEAWFRGGLVVYSGSEAPVVADIRCVASAHGSVSEEYAAALARLVRRTFVCEWALAESGIAGPRTGRRSAKPVGMVCLAVAGPKRLRDITQERGTSPRAAANVQGGEEQVWTSTRVIEDNGRSSNQHRFAVAALFHLHDVLSGHRKVR